MRAFRRCEAAAHGVLHEQGDGQRADAAGHRREGAGDRLATDGACTSPDERVALLLEVRQALRLQQVARLAAGSSTRFMPTSTTTAPGFTCSPRTKPGAADGRHQHVRLAGDRGQVARARVADRDGGVRVHQQQRHRLAHDVAAPEHHRAPPGERRSPSRRSSSMIPAGVQATKRGPLLHQQAHVLGMEAVHVLAPGPPRAARARRPPAAGSGSCTRMPWTSRAAVVVLDLRQHLGGGRRWPAGARVSWKRPSSSQARVLLRT